MKKFVIIGALAAMTLVTAVPAEAFFVGVGPRGGVRVGVGGFGYGPRFGYGYGYSPVRLRPRLLRLSPGLLRPWLPPLLIRSR